MVGYFSSLLAGVFVSEAFVARLSARRGLTPAQIRTAVRFAELAGGTEAPLQPSAFEALVERQLRHANAALGTEPASAAVRPRVTTWNLALLNTESRHPIGRMVEALRARGHGALCFYGPPGTGKTALAERPWSAR